MAGFLDHVARVRPVDLSMRGLPPPSGGGRLRWGHRVGLWSAPCYHDRTPGPPLAPPVPPRAPPGGSPSFFAISEKADQSAPRLSGEGGLGGQGGRGRQGLGGAGRPTGRRRVSADCRFCGRAPSERKPACANTLALSAARALCAGLSGRPVGSQLVQSIGYMYPLPSPRWQYGHFQGGPSYMKSARANKIMPSAAPPARPVRGYQGGPSYRKPACVKHLCNLPRRPRAHCGHLLKALRGLPGWHFL